MINEVDELKKNSRSSAEQEKDEACRQVEMECAEVIISLQKDLSSARQQLDASKKNELLAKQSLGEFDKIELLLDESIKTLVQKEVIEQNYVPLLRGMEEEISRLQSQLDQSDRCYKVRLKELQIKMEEVDDKASATLVSWNKEREVTV